MEETRGKSKARYRSVSHFLIEFWEFIYLQFAIFV